MINLKNSAVLGLLTGLIAMPAVSLAELPVEVDIDLLTRRMTLEQAGEELRRDAAEEGLDAEAGSRAVEVLGKLSEKGVPVNKAYETVSKAVVKGEDLGGLTEAKNVTALKKEAAQDELEEEGRREDLKAEDVAVAVNVLDDLVEKGIPVEMARDTVKEALKEDTDPRELQKMLMEEYARNLERDIEKGKPDVENIGEQRRKENLNRMSDQIRDIMNRFDGEDISRPGR